MNRQLAKAILSTLRSENVGESAQMLRRFTVRDWQRCYRWLDGSGLALYFFDKLESASMAHCLPEPVRRRLTENLDDNRAGSAELFCEFTRINYAFQNLSLPYATLKGFALTPDYCSHPSLRYQFDFDYLVRRSDACRFAEELSSLGYELVHIEENEWQFKAGTDRVPSIRELYKPKPQRAVELHFGVGHSRPADASDNNLLNRVRHQDLQGVAFPVLSPTDMFLTQAAHLFRHLGGEWTRISWLFEFRNFILAQQDNNSLWKEVHNRAETMEDSALAIGTATLLASMAFGNVAPPALSSWTIGALPHPVRLWIEHYGWDVLLAHYFGTKRYLFLQHELIPDESAWKQFLRAKMMPMHLPVRSVVQHKDRAEGSHPNFSLPELRFLALRMRFHLIENLRYLAETRRWKKVRSAAAQAWSGGHGDAATDSPRL
jgi:hypothetical protein